MTDPQLSIKLRHAKRNGDTSIDISGLSLTSIPNELLELTQLTKIDMSNNQIKSLDKISFFKNLTELNAKNNKISKLSEDILECTQLDNLRLGGNPITVSNGQLSVLFGGNVKTELEKYFGKTGGMFSGGVSPGLSPSGGGDTAELQMQILDLQQQIASLKAGGGGGSGALGAQRDWLSNTGPSSGFGMERPTTASSQNKKIADL